MFRACLFTKAKWKFVKNRNFLLFGLQLENEERYWDGSNRWNNGYVYGNKCRVDKKWLWGRFDRALPAWSWEMPVKRDLPAKIGRCSKSLGGHNFDFRAKSSRDFFIYILNILSGGFCSKVKIVTSQVFGTLPKVFFSLLRLGSTSGGRNLVLETLYPSLPYIFWIV